VKLPPPPTLPAVGPPPVVNVEEYRGLLRGEFEWVRDNVPHFECSDGEINMAYWYRCVASQHKRRLGFETAWVGLVGWFSALALPQRKRYQADREVERTPRN
jgi:hypothetical protein